MVVGEVCPTLGPDHIYEFKGFFFNLSYFMLYLKNNIIHLNFLNIYT